MASICEMYMNFSKNFIGICEKHIWLPHIEYIGIIEVKEQIWFTNVNYLKLST